VAEYKSSGPTYQRTVKATLRASYTNLYRSGLIKQLDVLEFRGNTTTRRPVLDALGGVRRHAAVEANYVDSHGQSKIGFGITKLLGFDLLPRIMRINKVKVYRPAVGEPDR